MVELLWIQQHTVTRQAVDGCSYFLVKLLQVMGRQKDICMKNTGPATLNCNAVTPRLPCPVMKSHRYKGKGDSKTRRERTALPFKVFNFSDDKALPRVKVWRGNQAVQLATSQQSYCLKEYSSRN
ncbi:Hypp376 [Branchiostoma lanceolatum]|uniref:Hypp376 protein n=1 Tax=Branchiostoma lanceolatum TaxID=7740 RepID=A0A8J9VZM7_BRALA|nr:Hypp376 [Branchiostoma lanceolatum]